MNRLNWIAGISAAIAMAGCTTLGETTALSSRLKASEYNSVGATYMERPTFVSLQTYSNGNTALVVEMDEYGLGPSGIETPGDYAVRFDAKHSADYVAMIDKYFEWEKLALERGDLIDREIGRAKGVNVNGDVEVEFSIFSGNATRHNLVTAVCAFGVCSREMHFDHANAQVLRGLLVDFGAGQVGHIDVENIYR